MFLDVVECNSLVLISLCVCLQLVWTAKMAARASKLNCAVEEIISYLPLSHVAAQILDIYIPLLFAATVYFAQPDALKVRSPVHYKFSCSSLCTKLICIWSIDAASCMSGRASAL